MSTGTTPNAPAAADSSLSRLYLVWFATFAFGCNLSVELGFPLKTTVWACLGVSCLTVAAYFHATRPRPDLRLHVLLVCIGAASVAITLAPFLSLGLGGSLGTAHADGWNHVARGLFIWDYHWGTGGPLPVIYQYATHLAGTRWGASALISGLSIFTHFGDPASALTLFFLLTASATFAAFWMLGTELFADWRCALLFAVFSAVVSWTPQILAVGNYENSLFNVYPPALAAILMSIGRRPRNVPDACLGAICAAAAFTGYPEGTAVLGVLLLPFIAASVTRPQLSSATKGFFVPFAGLFAVLVAPAVIRFANLVAMRWGMAVAEPTATALRPGETLFPGLLGKHALAAFFTYGPQDPTSSWVLTAAAWTVFPLLLVFGARALLRRSWAPVAGLALLAAAAIGFGVFLRYDYGIYKVANIGTFIWAPTLFAGVAALVGAGRLADGSIVPAPRILLLASLVGAAGYTKIALDPSVTLIPSARYRALAQSPALENVGEVELRISSAIDQMWSTYYLRAIPLTSDVWRAYIGQPHVLRLIDKAEKSAPNARKVFLTDLPDEVSRRGEPRLHFTEVSRLNILSINSPYGLERTADGRRFLWVGPAPVRFRVISEVARNVCLRCAQFLIGPNAPDPSRLTLEVTDAGGVRVLTVTPTESQLPLHVAAGEQDIQIRCITPPKTVVHANGDTRSLLLGMVDPRLE